LGGILSGTCHLKILRTADYFRENGGWRGTRKLDGGGVLSNQAIHHIDEIAYTVGIPRRVRAEIRTLNHDIEAEDLASAVWEYQGGALITLHATTSYPHPTWYSALELTGTQGAFARAGGGPFDDAWARYYFDGAWTDAPPAPAGPEWLNAADSFAAAVRQGAELTCPGRDGRRTQAILEAMYVSAYDAAGGWVDVAPEMD
jgi:predicted dehydrogenase